MSKIGDSIRRGLEEAVSFAEGRAEKAKYRVHVPAKVDVKAIRTGLGMTQEEFAARFGFAPPVTFDEGVRRSLAWVTFLGRKPSPVTTPAVPR